ncbi:DUF1631 family protein [Undibacterium sp. TS12]|uniref:DUF1631 family protein n=1 Tax=Undibacterium sp. TS12 TaxID=2908202 RepID=UPI001F4CC544|nr:DUF1631 family protein [Undibacterium sp. TS12]MCH8621379.1 DUF1631 domain-containing protein [Undibacterium sp. TS12]
MVANESLSSARAEFTHAFNHAVPGILPEALEALLAKANYSGTSSAEKSRIVNARAILPEKWDAISRAMPVHLAQLLDRSITTAYSTFRPASALAQATELALLDSSTFETTLRFNEMTQNFRDKAGQTLLDLNIRIAVLFGQDDIRERENPFRPYLLARCIFLAVEEQKLLPETEAILIEQLGETMASTMPAIYEAANSALERQGISANLTLKISKAPESQQTRGPAAGAGGGSGGSGASGAAGGQSAYSTMQAGVFPGAQGAGQGQAQVQSQGAFPAAQQAAMASPGVRLEQLFQTVRGKPLTLPRATPVLAQHTDGMQAATMSYGGLPAPGTSSGNAGPAWLSSVSALGGVLRQAFGETAALSASGLKRDKHAEGSIPFTARENSPVASANSDSSGRAGQFAHSGLPASVGTGNPDMIQVPAALVASHLQNIENQLKPRAETQLPPELSMGLSKVLGQMHKVMVPDNASMRDGQGEIRNLIREQKDALYSLAKDTEEQMCIDLVAMLFEVMLCDELVPFNIRISMGRLQFLILQLALKEKNLLSDSKHPARLLLNRICSIAYSTQRIGDVDNHVTEEIARIIKTLMRHDSEVPELFSRIQNRFETFIARELRTNNQHIHRTVKALGEAEIRFMRFACIAVAINKAMPKVNVDMSFRSFLRKEWVRAIEVAERTDAVLARRYRLLVPDLLWSVLPKLDNDDRNLLSSMLPNMVGTLRHGMDLMELEKSSQQKLLNWLAEAHAKALRPAADSKKPQGLSLPAMHERFEQFTNQPDTIEHSEVHHYESARELYQLKVFAELGLKTRMLDKEVQKQASLVEAMTVGDAQAEPELVPAYLERIVCGALVDIKAEKLNIKACLRWVDPNLIYVVLSIKGDEFPAVLSIRVLRELLDAGKLRFVEDEPLFERAIHTLLRSADEVDNVRV